MRIGNSRSGSRIRGTCFIGATLLCLLCLEVAQAARPVVTVMEPKNGAVVELTDQLYGKTSARGWPVVLVRPDLPGELWYIQAPPQRQGGYFKGPVRFGNAKTLPGSTFRLVVVMAQSSTQFEQFKVGDGLRQLPDLPRSADIRVQLPRPVVRQPAEAAAGMIAEPSPGATVPRFAPVQGKAPKDQVPLVLVRTAQDGEPWWVQTTRRLPESQFQSKAQFGNDKTRAGTEFRVVVLFLDKETAAQLKPGTALKELPQKVNRSEEVSVFSGAAAPANPVASAGG